MVVGPKMIREDDLGSEGSPTHLHIGQAWAGIVVEVAAAHTRLCTPHSRVHTFLLHLSSASLLNGTSTCEDFAMPGCVVGSELLPIAN